MTDDEIMKIGEYGVSLHGVWKTMKSRCKDEYNRNYKNYGARGISVCKEWSDSFRVFFLWAIKSGYNRGLSIERIDVNGNYEPSNCRWATLQEQNENKTTNIMITFDGEKKCLSAWAKRFDCDYEHLRKVYRRYGVVGVVDSLKASKYDWEWKVGIRK